MHQHSGYAALTRARGILFGADYNPEQWPPELWREDVELMRRAGVNLVTVGVFSWGRIEAVEGEREFGWLDDVLAGLHEAGIGVDLATPTASPPAWLGVRYPQTLPVDRDGVRLVAGSRNHFAPASAIYREKARAITADLARRYAAHPAVVMWHVGNEFGQLDFGEQAARAFRDWLRERYGSVERLNDAWGTAVWSQQYADFDEVLPPRRMPYVANPSQVLDFRRYTSDELLACYRELRDEIRAAGAPQPITTNFMGLFPHADYRDWAGEVDVIADDQYPDHSLPTASADAALVQDLMRSLGGGAPWMLMEQAVSATSWRRHNLPKTPTTARLDSLQAVARGADGICAFQWRQSRAGAERFHSAMVPHAGPETEVFEGVCRQGADLARLAPVVGASVEAPVALVFDWPSWWASDQPDAPTDRLDSVDQLRAWYRPLFARCIAADVVGGEAALEPYRVVLLPHAYLLTDAAAASVRRAVAAGAHVVIGPFSGVVDEHAQILPGRSPAQLRELVGVSGEEWAALPDGECPLATASALAGDAAAHTFGEKLRTDGAELLAHYADGPWRGRPVVTRNRVGAGAAWYVGAMLSEAALDAVLAAVLLAAGVRGAAQPAPGLEAVRRGDALFLLNRGDDDVTVRAAGRDLLTNETFDHEVVVAARDARVMIERHNP